MSNIAIRVEKLSKLYHLGRSPSHAGNSLRSHQHDTLRDALVGALPRIGKRNDHLSTSPTAQLNGIDLWALRDVSFEVKPGEVIGIIGRNGAGKSTLLKILSRITEPTSGRAEIHGRIASLLEVGTGFHPELTGRENIYLNGAILGMRRAEIERKFDEIVAFAEMDRFLDTPVKRYSSGMYVRLAFAVAAHLEPEILVIDEVLAVGDMEFQRKCLGKMGDVASGGRTVLFVSHNMSAVQRLCTQSMRLDHGRLAAWGNTADIVYEYVSSDAYCARPELWIDLKSASRKGSGAARFSAAKFRGLNGSIGGEAYSEKPLEVLLSITSDAPRAVGSISVGILDQYGTKLINADTISQARYVNLQEGDNLLRFRIENLHINSGLYVVRLWMSDPMSWPFDFIESAFGIQVFAPETEGFGVKPTLDGLVTCQFQVEELESSETT